MNSMISLFIDNELNLEEKCLFVEKIRNDSPFFLESLQLLHQEILLRSDIVDAVPQKDIGLPKNRMLSVKNLFRPLVLIPAAIACMIVFLNLLSSEPAKPNRNRFVIYRPDVSQVEIIGSFTGWKRVPLLKIGTSGYWEGVFELSEGEHRYSYILEGDEPCADPTVLSMEKDDFGGINSIIHVVNKA